MTKAEELNKLKKMRDDGTITDEQYERARARLLEEEGEVAGAEAEPVDEDPQLDNERDERRPRRRRRDDDDYDDDEERRPSRKKVREYCMLLHLSLFAGHTVPLGGIIVPIVIWQTQKDQMPEIDEHGKNAVNWIISSVLYALICIPLCFVIVGILLLIILGVLNIVFPIIAAIKANEGRAWPYPLAIPFIR